jgi:hypothetical protein
LFGAVVNVQNHLTLFVRAHAFGTRHLSLG